MSKDEGIQVSTADFKAALLEFHNYLTNEYQGDGTHLQGFQLLIALAKHSHERLNTPGCSPTLSEELYLDKKEMYEMASRHFERPLRKDSDQWVTDTWKVLLEKYEEIHLGFIDYVHANKIDLKYIPKPDSLYSGGGQAERKYFFFAPATLSRKQKTLPISKKELSQQPAQENHEHIIYRRESVKKVNRFYRWLIGKPLRGMRWRILATQLFIYATVGISAAMYVAYSLLLSDTPSVSKNILAIMTTAICFFYFINPYANVFSKRAIVAPVLMQSNSGGFYEDILIYEDDPDAKDGEPIGILKLVQYHSTCPVCGGKIGVIKGENELKGRLVGSCRKSPDEHIYSFDYVTRKGVPLRRTQEY